MKQSINRAISLLLCFAMVFGFLPAITSMTRANAAEPEVSTPAQTEPLLYETFDNPDNGLYPFIPEGWKDYNISEENPDYSLIKFVSEADNNYLRITDTSVNNVGITKERVDLSENPHIQVRISLKFRLVGGENDNPINQLQTAFYVYDAEGNCLNNGADINPMREYGFGQTFTIENYPTKDDAGWYEVSWIKYVGYESAAYFKLSLIQTRNSTGSLDIDDVKVEYAHSYNDYRDSGIVAAKATETTPAYNYIKCDCCDVLAKDDAAYTGATLLNVDDRMPLVETFETELPAGWYSVTDATPSNSGQGRKGIGTRFSVAGKNGHTQIKLTVKYSGTGSLIARLYDVATGEQIAQPFNTPATAEGVTAEALFTLTDVANIELRLLGVNADTVVAIDDVKVEYIHSFNNKLPSDTVAIEGTATTPAYNYVKCDNCSKLSDETVMVDNRILVSATDVTKDTAGWYVATDAVPGNSGAGRVGVGTKFSVAGKDGHTQIRLTVVYTGNLLARLYDVATGAQIAQPVSPATAVEGATATATFTLTDVEDIELRLLASAAGNSITIHSVLVEYVHSYNEKLDSGVAAEDDAFNYIKCDYCDALAKDDATYTGETTLLVAEDVLVYEGFETEVPEGWYTATDATPSNSGAGRRGVGTKFSVAGSAHTQIKLTVKFSGTGSLLARLYGADGEQIAQPFNTAATAEGVTAEYLFTLTEEENIELRLLRLTADAVIAIDEVKVEYVHSFAQNLDSGVAKDAYFNYIKCDYCDELSDETIYIHSYDNNVDSGIKASAYTNYIKCDTCEMLKVDDPNAEGADVLIVDDSILVYETFETELPYGWYNAVDGTRNGVGTQFSVAGNVGHPQIKVTVKYSGTGAMVARLYANGTQIAQLFNEATNADGVEIVKTFDLTEVQDIELRLLKLNAEANYVIDEVKIEYVHTFEQQLDSGVKADKLNNYIKCDYCDELSDETIYAHSYNENLDSGLPASAYTNYIKCDTCGLLKKNDENATGAVTVVVVDGVLVYENFETEIPGGWYSATDSGRNGIGTKFSIAGKGEHTQIRLVVKYSGTGSLIARFYNEGSSSFAVQAFNEAVSAEGQDKIINLDFATTETIELRLLALNANDEIVIEEVLIEYVHSFEQKLDSGVAADEYSNYVKCDYCDALGEETIYVHTYEQNLDSGIATGDGYRNWIKCDDCDVLKKDDPSATGALSVPADKNILVYENFETEIPGGWYSATDSGRTGVGTMFSAANKGAHTQIRLTVKFTGTGSMVARLYANGTQIAQPFNEATNADGVTIVKYFDLTEAQDIELRLLKLDGNADYVIDEVKIEYVHTYEQKLVSNVLASAATGTKPAAYYIKCDLCDALSDEIVYVGAIAYEDFENATVGANKYPAGWTQGGFSGTYGIEEDANGNKYYYLNNAQSAQQGTSLTINLPLGDYGTHTKVVITMMVKGGGDYAGVLQGSFVVMNAEGVQINNNTSGNSYSHIQNYNNTTWEDWTRIVIVKDIVLPENVAGEGVDNKGVTATLKLNQRWGATAPLYIDDIYVNVYHTYANEEITDELYAEANCGSGATYCIKCDHCDVLKKDDALAEGDVAKAPEGSEGVGEHNYEAVVTEPTCAAPGKTVYTCSVCGDSYEEIGAPALDHTPGDAEQKDYVAGTCTTPATWNEVISCTVCGAEISSTPMEGEMADHNYEAVVTEPTCTTAGFTTYTCSVCGDTYEADEVPALDHAWTDGICGTCGEECEHNFVDGTCTICGMVNATCAHAETKIVVENMIESTNTVVGSYDEVVYCAECGAEISRESKAALLNPFYNQSLSLESKLTLMINIKWDTLDAAELAANGYYIVFTKTDADGVGHDTIIPMSEWEDRKDANHRYRLAYDQIAAKEMMDKIEWALYNSANERVSVVYELTIAEYALEQIDKYFNDASYAEYVTLLVDMLNYGTAAQKYFQDYNKNNYANSILTEAHQARATQEVVTAEPYNNKANVWYNTMALQLESSIEMVFVFYKNDFGVPQEDLVATIKYTSHAAPGVIQTVTIEGKDFEYRSNQSSTGKERFQLTVDWLATADGDQMITIEFADKNGNVIGSVSNAVKSLVSEWAGNYNDEIYPAMIKFMNSAYAYFH